MRITNSMISSTYLTNLNNNLLKMDTLYQKGTTNRNILRLSDDPVGLLSALQVRQRISDITQYTKKNIQQADLWMKQSESSLTEINEIIKDAYELALKSSTAGISDTDKNAMAAELLQLRHQLVDACNSKVNNQYVFGGYNTTQAPFTVDASEAILYNGVDMVNGNAADLADLAEQELQIEIASGGLKMDISFTGVDVMGTGNDNLYNIIDSLYNDLLNGSDNIGQYADKLLDKQSYNMGLISDIGARTNRLSLLQTRYAEDLVNYKTVQSDIEDADMAEIAVHYKMAQSVFDASLMMGASLIKPTLLDYL